MSEVCALCLVERGFLHPSSVRVSIIRDSRGAKAFGVDMPTCKKHRGAVVFVDRRHGEPARWITRGPTP